jgi:hypothetical protein
MTQPPYVGQASGKTAQTSNDFGATTVSGSPLTRRGVDPGAATTSVPPSHAGGPKSPGSSSQLPPVNPPPRPNAVPTAGAPPKANRAERARGPRRARLQLRHINPWTVLKFSCVLSIALFFVWLIVVGVLFGILDAAGVVGKVNDTVTTINGSGSKAPVNAGIVFGGAAIIGVINIVLFIALTTIGSVVYNLCADLVGGIELTLSES